MRANFAQLRALAVARLDVLELVVEQREVQVGDLVALHEHSCRLALGAVGQHGQVLCFLGDGLARIGDLHGCGGVLLADRLEVVDTLDQIAEAVRLEDHSHDARRRVLVGGDHLGDKHLSVLGELDLQRCQVRACRGKLRLEPVEQSFLDAQSRFERVKPRFEVFDAALKAVDLVGVGLDFRAERDSLWPSRRRYRFQGLPATVRQVRGRPRRRRAARAARARSADGQVGV